MIDECKRILECINSVVYVFEQSSGRLVFANQAARELIGLEGEAYIGRNHTEFFEESVNSTGQDALGDVSDDGSGHVAQPADEPGGASDRAVYNGRMLVRSTGIGMDVVSTTFAEDDICYRIVVAEDSRSTLDQRQALEQIVKNELVVTEALSVAMEQEDPDEAIDSLLRELGKGFKADRSYIFEANEQGGFDNTYEWCREGVVPEIENLQNVSEQILVPWNNAFDEQGYLFIRDLDAYQSVDPDVYAVLQPQQIHSLVVAPLTTLTTKRVGFFGVDNPDIKMLENNEEILSVLGHFIASLISHRTIIERLQYVSERDDLTKAYNRTSARRLLDSIEGTDPYNMIVLDIDHFKDINEIYGARFGDYVLQQFADRLNDYLEDYPAFLARYGSDEFLVVLRGKPIAADDPFVTNLRKAVHVPMEIGTATVAPTISIGITYSNDERAAQEKVAEATRALREAKKLGRTNTTVFYRPDAPRDGRRGQRQAQGARRHE